jgi:hypothetical protein
METTYQLLGAGDPLPSRFKRPDLTLSDRLFMAAVGNLPAEVRPWGSMTWLSDVFRVSRPTVYAIARYGREVWLQEPLAAPVGPGDQSRGTPVVAAPTPAPAAPAAPPAEPQVTVSERRIQRTLLTLALPGNAAIRPMQAVLRAAFDQARSVGYISELLTTAGQRAGQVLAQLDYRPLGRVIALRDETFFQEHPILLVVEPRTGTLLLGHVATDCSAETWGAALLVAQDRGVQLAGLVEDMARAFPKSVQAAGLRLAIQKDPWHVLDWAGRVRRELERSALQALATVDRLEKQLIQTWDGPRFEAEYIPAVAQADRLLAQHDAFARCQAHLADALELVDWRSGEIRDRPLNDWLLGEIVHLLAAIDHPSVRQFGRALRRYRRQLLTYLDWLAELLTPWRQRLAASLPAPADQLFFERTVARAWRLRQAVINGQPWQRAATETRRLVDLLVADPPSHRQLADDLFAILDGTAHASSLIETINGLMQAFLQARQAFHSLETAQAYLNLLVLWHNMRVFQRGKRAGKSPFQWAGITTRSDDWLALLGYPAA